MRRKAIVNLAGLALIFVILLSACYSPSSGPVTGMNEDCAPIPKGIVQLIGWRP